MIKPIDYWEEKIQLMPLQAETKSRLIRKIRKEYPNGISESDFMNTMIRDYEFSAFIRSIHKNIYGGLFSSTFSINILDLFK